MRRLAEARQLAAAVLVSYTVTGLAPTQVTAAQTMTTSTLQTNIGQSTGVTIAVSGFTAPMVVTTTTTVKKAATTSASVQRLGSRAMFMAFAAIVAVLCL